MEMLIASSTMCFDSSCYAFSPSYPRFFLRKEELKIPIYNCNKILKKFVTLLIMNL